MTTQVKSALEINQAGLCRELDRVYGLLTGTAAGPNDAAGPRAAALERLCEVFNLTPFERDLLLLCAGFELEARFSEGCSSPTLGMALSLPGAPHWSAIGPEGPLRYWRMIEILPGASLVRAPLKIAERVLHFLTGIPCLDEHLRGIVRRLNCAAPAKAGPYRACAAKVVEHWNSGDARPRPVLLVGRKQSDARRVAEELSCTPDLICFTMRAADIPAATEDRMQLALLWTREALMTGAALFIETSFMETSGTDAQEMARLAGFLDVAEGAIVVGLREGSDLGSLEGLRIPVPSLTVPERKTVWVEALGDAALCMNGSLDRIADYFDMDAGAIRMAGGAVRDAAAKLKAPDHGRMVWQECRVQARASFEGLAMRIEPRACWDDLILPEIQKETLRQIVAHVRQRSLVNGKWGFAERYSRGLGVTALFAGASGTGKTMAAEVIAGDLELDLFQIELSAVVSKYIGETEKNLRRIFDAAEASGAVLLFDEADALFGKRSEVKDSHDRYANLEISYLLQRMESYSGLAILTTNMKQALDTAFLRRIRFIVQFAFPAAPERSRIWQRVFPAQTPVGALDFARIAQLNVAGGVIRNIAVHAAFMAADQGSDVGMDHILRAAKVEYAKLDRPLTPSEIGGWS